ncbi:D-glycero-beta-D-manno-heptose-7-phosphate kinase [Mucilaginibacter sp. CAU 1740]|uniref:D-glycero-beta-D-manno-heptose-7-phosphate kinase n=1 Tax=Mucilaginibacter sp. CAU 1740 TaxID=3140365 RepID=UPI00325AAAEB
MLIQKVSEAQLKNKPKILVIGDLMIDRYIYGNSSRLSPEAPVPIVNIQNESITLGGAANVIQNLVSLGANVNVAGIIGNDNAGIQLIEHLEIDFLDTDLIVKDSTRVTTLKTRIMVGNHQLVRLDNEVTHPMAVELENELIEKIDDAVREADIVVLSDYNKGLLTESFTSRVIALATLYEKKVIVDPKGLDYRKYKGAFLIKPNRKELAEASKSENINSIEKLKNAASVIFDQTDVPYMVVTLSEQGMVLLSPDTHVELPVKATEVFDVTGAGDTVISCIAYFVSLGMDLEDACELANHAAAIVIRRLGAVTTTVEEILADLAQSVKQGVHLAH